MKKLALGAIGVLVAAGSFGAVSAMTNSDHDSTPPPSWISRNGSVDIAKAPSRISVGLPNELISKSPDGWGWMDSDIFLVKWDEMSIPVYATQVSDSPIGYFDRRNGRVSTNTETDPAADTSLTTEVAK